ncbi:MAG TPA: L-histidine N(alpha)-methyltransferase [Bryobacteraceae bacterium]|nr:L-histidine N(alpha)-methyltransferase [Bryobacteraceae bacterium]
MAASFAVSRVAEIEARDLTREFAADVRNGLRKKQKELPSKYLYDAVGSALFEAITRLPEYGLTRADERLLNRHAQEIAALTISRNHSVARVVELGSGSGHKAIPILRAISARAQIVSYHPVDVSAAALEQCRREAAILPDLRIRPQQQSYFGGLREAVKSRARADVFLVLFLGSSLGNFDLRASAALLSQIRQALRPGDALLLGTDWVKPETGLITAYDDPAGVTAAFNLNLLARVNRELGAAFDLRKFRHEARWSRRQRRIEMHLRALEAQAVEIPGAGCRAEFQRGETIWTESSYKFDPAGLTRLAARTGFAPAAQWIDEEWPFAENFWAIG